ncbi:MAG: lysylphosphatidylglycerol synthase transmembrane domain-containing protein [Planctomycetota bacterium]
MSHRLPTKKTLIAVLKASLAIVILLVLIGRIQAESGFERLLSEPKQWWYLGAAQLLVLVAFSLSYVRWYFLVRGLNLSFRLSDAFRLGTLGFMLNQVSPGSVGGDLLKAVFIAREQPDSRTEAVATVLIDRVIGLYGMLVIASLGLLAAGESFSSAELRSSLQLSVWPATLVGTGVLAFALSSYSTGEHVRRLADSLPLVGHTITRLIEAADVYRSRRAYLFAALTLALVTHCLLITAFWSVSRGLPVSGPTFAQNASLVPVCLVAGAVLPTPGGLGGTEGAFEFLYTSIGAAKGDGTIVALAYRAMTYVFASIGAFYYFSARKKVDELIHDAEVLSDEPV